MSKGSTSVTVIVAIFAVRWIVIEASSQRAIKHGSLSLYRAPFSLRVLFGVGGFITLYGCVANLGSGSAWWVSPILFSSSVLAFLAWPSRIEISPQGISECKWWGLRRRRIQWDEIEYVRRDPAEKSVYVVS